MDYDAWARWYDVVHAVADDGEVRYYVDLALASGGPVLEIGVGTGRIAIPIALAGIDVTGIDLYEPMLQRAREQVARAMPLPGKAEFVQADMLDFDLGRTFPLVTIPGRTLLLLRSAAAQRQALKRAAGHLAPGGSLALTVFNPSPRLLADASKEPFLVGETINPATMRRCRLWAVNRFDTLRQINKGLQIVEELDGRGRVLRRTELEVRVRYLYPSELHAMLRATGLRATEVLGDFGGGPLKEDSDHMVFVASRVAS